MRRLAGANSGGFTGQRGQFVAVGAILLLLVWVFSGSTVDEGGSEGMGLHLRATNRATVPELMSAAIETLEGAGRLVVQARRAGPETLGIRSKGTTDVGVEDTLTVADLASHMYITTALHNVFPGLNIVSEEKDDAEVGSAVDAPASVSLTRLDTALMMIPHGDEVDLGTQDVTVWIDPLDATREYSQDLTQYVTLMACVVVDGEPVAGVIHKPFESRTEWAWVGHAHSFQLKTGPPEAAGKTRITVSMSHAGSVREEATVLGASEDDIIPAAGAGYKVMELLDGVADVYLHKTKIKKWDVCAGNALLNSIGGSMTGWDGTAIRYGAADSPVLEGGLIATRSKTETSAIVNALRGHSPAPN